MIKAQVSYDTLPCILYISSGKAAVGIKAKKDAPLTVAPFFLY